MRNFRDVFPVFTPISLQELLADAGCSISDGDVLNTAVRRHQVGGTSACRMSLEHL